MKVHFRLFEVSRLSQDQRVEYCFSVKKVINVHIMGMSKIGKFGIRV